MEIKIPKFFFLNCFFMFNFAFSETKASKQTKKKLTQNLTKELEKAKTELHVTEDERQ